MAATAKKATKRTTPARKAASTRRSASANGTSVKWEFDGETKNGKLRFKSPEGAEDVFGAVYLAAGTKHSGHVTVTV